MLLDQHEKFVLCDVDFELLTAAQANSALTSDSHELSPKAGR